jgi:hypothetical protein
MGLNKRCGLGSRKGFVADEGLDLTMRTVHETRVVERLPKAATAAH